jgi:hypothetical protein
MTKGGFYQISRLFGFVFLRNGLDPFPRNLGRRLTSRKLCFPPRCGNGRRCAIPRSRIESPWTTQHWETASGLKELFASITLTGYEWSASPQIIWLCVWAILRFSESRWRMILGVVNCSPFLDHTAAEFPACSTNGGPCADDRLITSIGVLLPITLWGRSSLWILCRFSVVAGCSTFH